MIKYTPASERTLALFRTPFEQKLSPDNRWVRMAELVPWDEMAQVFFSCLSTDQGRPTVDLRIILGALMVKHIEGPAEKKDAPGNQGTLLLDATVGPLHIAYPTDTRLLSEGRRHSEQLIDLLYGCQKALWQKKPRTYRREAQRAFVSFSKKRRKSKKNIRKANGQQLRYLRRNLKTLHKMLDKLEQHGHTASWKYRQWRTFWILQELYRQQEEMFRDRRRRIDDRIVSIQQPYVRPIKRGKGGGKDTEFGPKINVSMSEGIARADQIDFNAFNEASYLQDQVEGYKELYGYYPDLVLADQIYWTRANRNYLKDRGIQIGGVPLGPSKELSKYEKYKTRKRNNKRSEVEGKFGQAKSKYGLDDLFTRLPQTIKAEINLIFLALNLIRVNKTLAGFIFYVFFMGRSLLSGYWNPKDETRKETAWVTGGRWMPKFELNPALCRTF